ncbi:SH3 domain-containing protein [Romboutsia sedimentorum]|uniref:SH3 domain-containing protein n=1 Tax=Romboutsia sedimentorum TaxID=1368474 RepID=A0ABT7E8P8_9FIRM|nr:SH3 domain-containing protein [Romboutsia sedimentorum]MDK2563300.1 SH3 domain-containing protein [Romboutsia sedimentorum]
MNKKIALATLIIPMAISNVDASGITGIITTSSLNIRSGAGSNYAVLFSVKKNEKVTINQTTNGWYKIKTSSGKEGWGSSNYILKSSPNDNSNGSNTSGVKKRVSINSLNMRSGAGTSYRSIATLNKGTVLDVVSQGSGWTKVKYEGRLGYVSSEYLQDIKPEATTQGLKEVTTSSLNVRSGANTSYSVVGKLKNGEKIKVISESNEWAKIEYKGKIAYTSSRYLKNASSSSNPVQNPPSTNPKPEGVNETKIVNTNSLNVRSGPGTNYSKVGTLKKGEKVGVMSQSSGWSKLNYNNKTAYTSSQYLIKDDTTLNPPSVVGGESSENINGATVNYKGLSYTLADHVRVQKERSNNNDLTYYLNPSNFTKTSKGMMQFLKLDSYKGGISANELNSYLNSLPKASSGTNVFYNKGQAFINAAQNYNIDLAYLVSHAMWETAYGKSKLAQGQTITSFKGKPLSRPVKVYNFFGIGAIDKSANVSGAEAAYSNGWTGIEKTIDGSAQWIAKNYIKNSRYNQNTVYKMKFSYDYSSHQYATDVNWPNGISGIMVKISNMYNSRNNLTFEVPSYKK